MAEEQVESTFAIYHLQLTHQYVKIMITFTILNVKELIVTMMIMMMMMLIIIIILTNTILLS